MRKKTLFIRCTYTENGKMPEELLIDSFRLFLHKALLTPELQPAAQHARVR